MIHPRNVRSIAAAAAICTAASIGGAVLVDHLAGATGPACHNNGTALTYNVVTTSTETVPCTLDGAHGQSLDVYLPWGTTVAQGNAYAALHGGALRLVVVDVDY